MRYVVVDVAEEIRAISDIARHADDLIERNSRDRLDHQCRTLLARLNRDDPNPFSLGLPLDKPITTLESGEYKGIQGNARLIRAEITFEWKLERLDQSPNLFCVKKGGVNVTFLSRQEKLRQFHYDICPGGADENGGRAFHPFSHFQYKDGALSDLPRLPSLVFAPADVFEQVLLDLWPMRWPELASGGRGRHALAAHHTKQKNRITASANRFIEVASDARLPLRGLQERLVENLLL